MNTQGASPNTNIILLLAHRGEGPDPQEERTPFSAGAQLLEGRMAACPSLWLVREMGIYEESFVLF